MDGGKTTRRARGRPKGSRNKSKSLSDKNVRQICELHNFHPVVKLINIARDSDVDADGNRKEWSDTVQFQATNKLADLAYGQRATKLAMGLEHDGDGHTQIALAFIESPEDFALPGEGSTESAAEVLRPAPLHGPGVSQTHGENRIRDQQADP